MKKGFFIAVLILLAFTANSNAATYYLDQEARGGACSDSNPGTLSQPWCTIAKANATLRAGDTVYIRAGTYRETIRPNRSGSLGNYIVYARYNQEEVAISNVTYGIYLKDTQYIIIDGITVNGWVPGYPDSMPSVKFWAYIFNSHHNIIKNCKMLYSGLGWYSFELEDSNYNKILNNVLDYAGSHEDTPWIPDDLIDSSGNVDYGDIMALNNSNYNIIKGNDMGHGGHGTLTVRGEYNVVRKNYFHNEWEKCLGTIEYGGIPFNRNLFEENIIAFANNTNDSGTMANPGWSMNGRNTIVRRNLIHSNAGPGMFPNTWSAAPLSKGHKIYSNVFYRNGHYEGAHSVMSAYGYGIVFEEGSGTSVEDTTVINNILFKNKEGGINCRNSTLCSKQIMEYNLEADPLFVDEVNYDFHLQSNSPAIDAGRYLSLTVSSGSGTTIPIDDASYFYDGWGIEGEQGDLIQLEGQTQTARITGIDYANNSITVDRSLTWSAEQGVSLPYKGSAPDIGAFEYQASILYGDVSENGAISAYDASLTAQYTVGNIGLTETQKTKADVTGNSQVSATDASWIAKKVVDPGVVFPVEE